MTARLLITDGGSHPPEKWAVATAEAIFDINPAMAGDRLLAAKKLQVAIAEALMPHHGGVQEREKSTPRLEHSNEDNIAESLSEAEEAYAAIKAAASGTPWADHFDDPARAAAIKATIASHFMTAKDIERQYHARRNPSDAGAAYMASRFAPTL